MDRKKSVLSWISVMMTVCTIAGCGNLQSSKVNEPESEEQTTAEVKEENETVEMISVEEEILPEYRYLETMMIEDYYGDHTEHEMFAPVGSNCENGFLSYYDHGLSLFASVYSSEISSDWVYDFWESSSKGQVEEWQEDPEYSDIQVGENVTVGDDRYMIISANRLDYNGIPYIIKKLFYLDMREDNRSVRWNLELSEFQWGKDAEAEAIVGEIAQYYGIDPDSLTVVGEWASLDAQREMASQDAYEPEEGSPVLEKVDGYQYMGKATVAFDDGAMQCPIMVPMGRQTSVNAWRVYSDMHGVSMRIDCDKMYLQNHFAKLEDSADFDCSKAEESGAKNIKKSVLMTMKGYNTAAYNVVVYEEPDETKADYSTVAKVCCMINVKDAYLLCYDITLRSSEYDDSTDILLRELETAYGIDLSDFYHEKGSATDEGSNKQETLADLLKTKKLINSGDSSLPETILWFNASYATLTYSNGWDWHLIGGIEPTEDNIATAEMLLRSSWSVRDRESALETVDSLKTKGHREKCRECMEQLEDWGLLDVDRKDFLDKLSEKKEVENPGRYVIAYVMHENDVDPEYITAWDLCRVNQLYADYYLCGYMTYEEAMDAALENSLILQEMYDSWEEMMDAYMLGYQFWQGDLAVSEDSPTLKRYHYYEMLDGMPDGPYTLDWDMKLKKSW